MRLYIKNGSLIFGPFPAEELRRRLMAGKLDRDILVSEDRVNWKATYEVPELDIEDENAPLDHDPFASAAAVPIDDRSTTTDVKEWYISDDGKQGYGKFTIPEIVRLIETGKAPLESLVWRSGEDPRTVEDHPAFKPYLGRLVKPAASSPAADSAPESRSASYPEADKKEWFIKTGLGVTFGPYSARKLLEMADERKFSGSSLVWRNKERPAKLDDVYRVLESTVFPVPATDPAPMDNADAGGAAELSLDEANRRNRRLRTTQNWSQYLTAFATLSYLALAIFSAYYFFATCKGGLETFKLAFDGTLGVVLVLLWFFTVVVDLVGYCFGLAFIHAFWSSIPESSRPIPPGRAASFMIFPFLRMFWCFPALRNGAVVVNKLLFEEKSKRPEAAIRVVNEFYATLFCVLGVLSRFVLFPFSFFLFGLPDSYTTQMRDAAIRLNELRAS